MQITTAVLLEGNAVAQAQSLSAMIITSGLLGIFWYHLRNIIIMIGNLD
jgi:hypothetical protein